MYCSLWLSCNCIMLIFDIGQSMINQPTILFLALNNANYNTNEWINSLSLRTSFTGCNLFHTDEYNMKNPSAIIRQFFLQI